MKKFTSHSTTGIQRVIIFLAGSLSLVPTGCSANRQVMPAAYVGGCAAGEESQHETRIFFNGLQTTRHLPWRETVLTVRDTSALCFGMRHDPVF